MKHFYKLLSEFDDEIFMHMVIEKKNLNKFVFQPRFHVKITFKAPFQFDGVETVFF